MEPQKLEDYFLRVHDFLYKSFRDDCKLFIGLRSSHRTNIRFRAAPSDAPHGPATGENPGASLSSIWFSPRLMIREDGTSHGKVKVALNLAVPDVCHISQKLLVDSTGKATGVIGVDQAIDGLEVQGRATVNTILPATDDALHARVQYVKRDYYCAASLSRNGFGSSGQSVEFGAKFKYLILGAGATTQKFSAREMDERATLVDTQGGADDATDMFFGGGFHGRNWSIGARMQRVCDCWSSAQLALFRKISASTAVACDYDFDLNRARAHVTLGASQGFSLRLPAVLAPSAPQSAALTASSFWTDPVPLVGAIKADSNGAFLGTIRGLFNGSLHWGIVFKKHLSRCESPWMVGFQLSMEDAD